MYLMRDYDEALKLILNEGVTKENRTGVKARSVCGIHSRYRIDEYFPIITGRKIWPKAIFAELVWFISGSTNNNDLKRLGANFWTPWVDEEFEKKHGYAPGCFGPLYGFQLRYFGGCYGNGIDEETPKYGFGGYDQLSRMVRLLREDPDSRRNLFSLWNPKQLDGMRLPPCHYTFQVYSHKDSEGQRWLSGMLTQRSCDFPVGVPANIQFYSALIYLLAQQTNHLPYEFIHSTVDSHIYEDQIPGVVEYLVRDKPPSPKLTVEKAPSIEDYMPNHFVLHDYNPQSAIDIPVAV